MQSAACACLLLERSSTLAGCFRNIVEMLIDPFKSDESIERDGLRCYWHQTLEQFLGHDWLAHQLLKLILLQFNSLVKQSSKLSLSLTELSCYFLIGEESGLRWLWISQEEFNQRVEDLRLECPVKQRGEVNLVNDSELSRLHFKHLF